MKRFDSRISQIVLLFLESFILSKVPAFSTTDRLVPACAPTDTLADSVILLIKPCFSGNYFLYSKRISDMS